MLHTTYSGAVENAKIIYIFECLKRQQNQDSFGYFVALSCVCVLFLLL